MGRKIILTSKEDVNNILTLTKLRLNLTEKDLSDRFDISQSTVSSTFKTWIRVLAKVLANLIFVPD